MPEAPFTIDRALARRRFERAAPRYAEAAHLEAEIGRRMLERLDYVRLAPRRILDAGCGPGREARALARRYRRAQVLALDFSLAMLTRARRGAPWPRRIVSGAAPRPVCAQLDALPLREASIDLVWSNMALHWIGEPLGAFREFRRVLAVGGLLVFSTLGPDTLKELRAAAPARVHRFLDMHDLGDRLVAAGFADPVMDMEMIKISYGKPETFFAELKTTGQTDASSEHRRGLAGRQYRVRLLDALASSDTDARLSATFEIVYGHAWRLETPRKGKGDVVQPVRFRARRASS